MQDLNTASTVHEKQMLANGAVCNFEDADLFASFGPKKNQDKPVNNLGILDSIRSKFTGLGTRGALVCMW